MNGLSISPVAWRLGLFIVSATLLLGVAGRATPNDPRGLEPLPPPLPVNAKHVELGRFLFFDPRLAGDGSTACSTCHIPEKGWADGMPLARGYPGALYFRNAPTVLNAAYGERLYWDGRLPASDLPTAVRDHITEAHFMQADGRLVIERLRQIPFYEKAFPAAFGGEPTFGRILNSVAAYLATLRSEAVPFDRFLRGEEGAISAEAKRGLNVFAGKAGCIQCHDGPMLSDGDFHNLGLGTAPDIFRTPERHISFRRFFKILGVAEYVTLREDVGLYALSKRAQDRGRFRTPTLREVSRTAPYMHDGSIATLEQVVEFYNRGGGNPKGKDARLRPLGLTAQEKLDLAALLKTLSGRAVNPGEIEPPPYALRAPGGNQR